MTAPATSRASTADPFSQVLHLMQGRVRLHLPGWTDVDPAELERALGATAGVHRVSANAVTRNILIHYDPDATGPPALQQALRAFSAAPARRPAKSSDTAGLIQERLEGRRRRARIAVPDLDCDPKVAARVLRRLRRRPGVSASANPLTGRVLVEFDEAAVSLEQLLGDALGTGHAPESRPHPLDRAPMIQGTARLAGAALGLAVIIVRQLLQTELRSHRAATIAAVLSALQGSPPIRHALRRLLGPAAADAALSLPSIAALTFAGNPLGLALAAWDALRLVGDLHATRQAWDRYEQRSHAAPAPEPGATVTLDVGQHAALPGVVQSGIGLAIAADGLPFVVQPGDFLEAGTRIHSGPATIELGAGEAFDVGERPDPPRPAAYDWYMQRVGPVSLGLATLLALVTRSFARGAATLLLVNARPALVGIGAAETGARAQVARSRGVVVGTRPERRLRKPNLLLLSSSRLLTRGLELSEVVTLDPEMEERAVVELAGSLAQAADSPWSAFLRPGTAVEVEDAATDESGSHGVVRGRQYRLRELREDDLTAAGLQLRRRHDAMLLLEEAGRPLAALVLRPRLSTEAERLRRACGRAGVRLQVLCRGNPVQARGLAQRASVELVEGDVVTAIRTAQQNGDTVAFASDGLEAGPGFAAADLAIGVADDRSGFGARADLLAADLGVIAGIIDACAHRDAAAQDAFVVSLLTDALGLVLSLRGTSTVEVGSRPVELGSLAALALSRMQFRNGGGRPAPIPYSDPRPERWGRQAVESVLQLLHSSSEGLSSEEARSRRVVVLPPSSKNAFLQAVQTELRSPLISLLAAGAVVSLALGSAGDVVIIVITLGVNVILSAWQSYRAGSLAKEVESIGMPVARVLRDGSPRMIRADELVPGDVLVLQSGDRIAADARLIRAEGVEVDEAALTGESLPVAKTAAQGNHGVSVVLAGTAMVMGNGLAIVVAVGEHTRMGAMAAALSHDEGGQSPLGVRLAGLVRTVVPLSFGGGLVVVLAGVLWGEPLVPRIALGLSIALAVFPEGLPLLAAVGQSAVASRLAKRNALVRRVAAIEALGRVDVACVDKTGTLTTGTLAVQVISDFQDTVSLPAELTDSQRRVLLAAALASPRPDAEDVAAHSTDLAIVQGAESAGLAGELDVERTQEAKFNSVRAYHAAQARDRVWVKGAPEVVASRCRNLDPTALLKQAERLAAEGLRVLLVAEGPAGTSVDDPQELTAIGFVGISDPLRESVPEALRRCREAGIMVMMLTGDHPVTARTIGRAAGLELGDNGVCTGAELRDLADDELDRKLERVSVIARATPFDKLRIVESLQRRGHTVAMTGDGINDAPALHLADVGVAMGGGAGTEVARQSSDLILADDDFSTLVDALVEGRGFWHSIRRALGLLLGGNLGELALVVSAAGLGRAVPLTVRQILATNLITDALPALAVATRPPEHRHLPELAREGPASLDRPLRDDILRRSVATAAPSIAAYLLALGAGDLAQARSVAFSAIVSTQLTQTLALGRAEGTLTRPVAAAVLASGGAMGLLLGVSPLRRFFDLVLPSPYGWTLIAGSAVVAPVLNRMLTLAQSPAPPELSPSVVG